MSNLAKHNCYQSIRWKLTPTSLLRQKIQNWTNDLDLRQDCLDLSFSHIWNTIQPRKKRQHYRRDPNLNIYPCRTKPTHYFCFSNRKSNSWRFTENLLKISRTTSRISVARWTMRSEIFGGKGVARIYVDFLWMKSSPFFIFF